jgi:hypothetical protein
LKDSNASPKVKTTKEGIEVHSQLATLWGVKGMLQLWDGD